MKGLTRVELTELQVLYIVKDWYTNGLYRDILQDEQGCDLEEICENRIDEIQEELRKHKKNIT